MRYTERDDLDTQVLDLGFDPRLGADDRMRLVFHPAVRPNLTDEVLEELAQDVETSLRIERLVADLRRREHERGALYELALQLTERPELSGVLDRITQYARDLLSADRAVVCLADPSRPPSPAERLSSRRAIVDDGRVCLLAHEGIGPIHARNPALPGPARRPRCRLDRPAAARTRRAPRRAVRRPRDRIARSARPRGRSSAPSPTWRPSPSGRRASTRPRSR